MSKNVIIALSGWKQSGKDTIANLLVKNIKEKNSEIEIQSVSFASSFKEVIKIIFGVSEDDVQDKELPLNEVKYLFKEKKSYRDLCILIGESFKELTNKNIWASIVERKIVNEFKKKSDKDRVFIITDLRYKPELAMLNRMRKHNNEVYHYCVFRKEAVPAWAKYGLDITDQNDFKIILDNFENIDKSEYEWCVANPKFSGMISNDGTLEDLEIKTMNIINNIWK